MSEKVTFQELIDAMSEETDRSKQFTHDFMKGLVSVIHRGLEEDRKVNIAGLGKFGLREVDEREGYNPQTGEPMTIPAHNRVTFTAYKELRERVNAPYAHREPELLDDDEPEEDTTSRQSDFIPTAPPTRSGGRGPDGGSGDEARPAPSSVVEYAPEMNDTDQSKDSGGQGDSSKKQEDFDPPASSSRIEKDGEAEEDRFGFRKSRRHRRSDANWPLIVAAAFVLMVIVAATWMLSSEVFDQVFEEPASPSVTQVEETGESPAPAGKSEEALNEITGDNETVSRQVGRWTDPLEHGPPGIRRSLPVALDLRHQYGRHRPSRPHLCGHLSHGAPAGGSRGNALAIGLPLGGHGLRGFLPLVQGPRPGGGQILSLCRKAVPRGGAGPHRRRNRPG
ncbi:MAG: HU family DNA-binding protein [Balneolaceae bacterium]|nr:HU family DNA-binding protein [Balneolaceae bacterium]